MKKNNYRFGFNDGDSTKYKLPFGLNKAIIQKISKIKNEPEWMYLLRYQAYTIFKKMSLPKWGPSLAELDFNKFIYFVKNDAPMVNQWDNVPDQIKKTFKKIGVIDAEAKYLHGLGSQYDSEFIYLKLQKQLSDAGIIFTDMDGAVKKYPNLVKKYFGSVIRSDDNKFAALNSAVWSGGVFLYIPRGIKITKPLQSYFRINTKQVGQFERSLLIIDEQSQATYIEGCTAPVYDQNNLHAAVVEIIVKKSSEFDFITLQNWSSNVYNFATKRAIVDQKARISWVDGNLGSKLNMKYPCCILKGDGSIGECISVALSNHKTVNDTGAKMIHLGKNTRSRIISKTVVLRGGDTTYRGLVKIDQKALNAVAHVSCDTLMVDKLATVRTFPTNQIGNQTSKITHEAKISRVNQKQIFYLMSRGISYADAQQLIMMGFIKPLMEKLPMEYAVEINRLIKAKMIGAIG